MRQRNQPHDLTLEKSLLASVLLDVRALDVIAEIIEPDDWYSSAHREIWDVMIALNAQRAPIEPLTMRVELVARKALAKVGGDEFLASLMDTLPNVAAAESHARIVRSKGLQRRMITAASLVAAEGMDLEGDVQSYLDRSEARIFAAAQDRHASGSYEQVGPILARRYKELDEIARSGNALVGLSTGLVALNGLLGGLKRKRLYIVAGRPGMGKTALAGGIADAVAKAGNSVLVFSLEMSREEWIDRMMARPSRVDLHVLESARLSGTAWSRVAAEVNEISKWRLFVDDTPALSVLSARSRARRVHAQHGLDLVVVDYLQLMRSGFRRDKREEEIREISGALKALAKELDIPVLALSQLNRDCEKRVDKRPMLSDLRESGAVEQDADAIVFVFRDDVYNKDSDKRGMAEIIVAKHRQGPTGSRDVRFFKEHTLFTDLESVRNEDFIDEPSQLEIGA